MVMSYFKIPATAAAAYVFLCFSVSITLLTATDYDTLVSPYCPDPNSNFTSNSTYQTNLNELLSYLSSNSSALKNGYYNTTVGAGDDTVYGAYLCRGDLTAHDCGDCVSAAQPRLFKSCPVEKSSMVWLSDCYMRFSDQSFFSVLSDQAPVIYAWNQNNVSSDQNSFMQLLGETINAAAEAAARGGSDKKFGTKEANVSSFQTLYTLAQCTPDLSELECRQCLKSAIGWIPNCCNGKQGGRVRVTSCNIRYESYPFYTLSVPTQPPPPPPPTRRPIPKDKSRISAVIIIAIVAPIVFVSLVTFFAFWIICTRAKRKKDTLALVPVTEESDVQFSSVDFFQFEFDTIIAATNNFSDDNKLGEGGFGVVYRGTLHNGQDIAVKRLSRTSRQGADEFKNEVVLVAKLQHRNLVRLLGFCLDGSEKMLIYEFVPNKSLDHFLFDPYKQQQLNWARRYKIIEGIARGLLYLHEDSQLKIIHRDLKASNVLLDRDLNPKISDFGMARLLGVDETQAITNRVVGTYGYMSPEYAMRGCFSIKVDVYSFGVLVLEIISGKKITSFYESGYDGDLLNYSWKHWREGTPLELLDVTLRDSYSRAEVIRCIHIGLSCVQGDPAQRPTMQAIVLMLNSHSITLASPKRPAAGYTPTRELQNKSTSQSVAEASITDVYPR